MMWTKDNRDDGCDDDWRRDDDDDERVSGGETMVLGRSKTV